MVETDFILLLIQMIVSGAVFVILMRQRIVHKIRPLNWMAAVFLLAFFRATIDFMLNYVFPQPAPLNDVHFIVFALTLLVFYFYAEFINADHPKLFRLVIVSLLFGMFLTSFLFVELLGSQYPLEGFFNDSPVLIFEPPFDLFQLVVWSFSLYIFAKIVYYSPDRVTRRYALLLCIAIFVFVISSILELSENFSQVEIPSTITTVPAFFVIFLVYLLRPDFAYATPARIYRIMVIHETGPTLINLVVDEKYRVNSGVSSQLIGGVTTSINRLLREITQNDDNVEKIDLSQTTFLFQRVGSIFAIIETERSTRILKDALRQFTEDFVEKYKESIEEYSGDLSAFLGFEGLIRRYFPFIVDPNLLENVND